MAVWKLRVGVYGLLAVVAALVLWQSGALAGDPPRSVAYTGSTTTGSNLRIDVLRGRVAYLMVDFTGNTCNRNWGWGWSASPGRGGSIYRRSGSQFAVHEERRLPRYPKWRISVDVAGRFDDGGRIITGLVGLSATDGRLLCRSGPTRFTARPHP
jgi:hypothetical protein